MREDQVLQLHQLLVAAERFTELLETSLEHHGSLEYGSPVRPMTLEAEIVHWADESSAKSSSFVDAAVDESIFAEGSEISERVWTLDNRRIWQKKHDWQ